MAKGEIAAAYQVSRLTGGRDIHPASGIEGRRAWRGKLKRHG